MLNGGLMTKTPRRAPASNAEVNTNCGMVTSTASNTPSVVSLRVTLGNWATSRMPLERWLVLTVTTSLASCASRIVR